MDKFDNKVRSGFTLVELMVAIGIMGIVVVLIMQTFNAQQRAYFSVEDLSEVQQGSSAVQTLFDADLRHAGFLVPPAAAVCALDYTPPGVVINSADLKRGNFTVEVAQGTDVLWVSASGLDTIDPISALLTRKNQDGTPVLSRDLGVQIASYTPSSVFSSSVPPAGIVGTFLLGGVGSIDNPTDTSSAAWDFRTGMGVIFVRENGSSVIGCGRITAGTVASYITVQILGVTTSDNIGDGAILAIPAHLYFIAAPSPITGNQPVLMRDTNFFAPGVEDLQVAVFVDRNGDRKVDTGEYLGGPGTSFSFFNVGMAANYVVGTQVREARVAFMTRSLEESISASETLSAPQFLENHNSSLTPDRFVRRANSVTAWLRNVSER